MVAKDLSREELQEVALADEKVKAEINGKEIVKVIAAVSYTHLDVYKRQDQRLLV